MTGIPQHSITQWLEANEKHLLPPVMNKLMYGAGQLKVMYVGGPNIRSDYHLEQGEELFYMHKGDMLLKLVVHGKFVDVPIKEGEIFLLPGRIPHSPQRFPNTLGLVIERERLEEETDCLKWFIPGTDSVQTLYEEFFHCYDLGVQLKPVILRFFDSEQKKTGKPLPGSVLPESDVPVTANPKQDIPAPINVAQWIEENRVAAGNAESGYVLFPSMGELTIRFYHGIKSNNSINDFPGLETWIWQWKGSSSVSINHLQSGGANVNSTEYKLQQGDCVLVEAGKPFSFTHSADSECFSVQMVPKKQQ